MKAFPKKIKVAIIVLLSLVLASAAALAVRLVQLQRIGGGTAVVPDNLIGSTGTAPDGTAGTTTVPGGTVTLPGTTATAPGETSTAPVTPGATVPPVTTTPDTQQTATVISLYQGHPGDNQKYQVHNMFPGDTETRYFAVDIRHSAAVTVCFAAEVTEQSKDLGEVLEIRVTHLDTGTLLYDGSFAELDPDGYEELFAAPTGDQTVAYYEIQVSLPTSTGNEYQAASLKADFFWSVKEQEALEPPQTGDKAPVYLWLAIAAVSGLSIAVLLCCARRKESRHES